MRLINFCIGQIREQLIDGVLVPTAIVKNPIAPPWTIDNDGARGDHVAVHTDHLYAFDYASYTYWAKELGTERRHWGDGFFGENLTLDAIDSEALRIGDIFSIGDALLVVAGPRIPCFKLAWRLDQAKSFINQFRTSGHSGVYLTVLRAGLVHANDELTLESTTPENPTVAEVARVANSSGRVSRTGVAIMKRALASEYLSLTVRAVLSLKVSDTERRRKLAQGGWSGWRTFLIQSVVYEADRVVSFGVIPDDGRPSATGQPGQHLTVKLRGSDGASFVRTFSISEWNETSNVYRLTVKCTPGGRAVPAMLAAADGHKTLEARQPTGAFRLDMSGSRSVVLVAAGIGITPIMAMIHAHIRRGPGAPDLWVFYSVRDFSAAPFYGDLLNAVSDRVHLRIFHTGACFVDCESFVHERISAPQIVDVMKDNRVSLPRGTIKTPWFDADFYICGPAAFNIEIAEGLVAEGCAKNQVRYEAFEAGVPGIALATRHSNANVTFGFQQVDVEWLVEEKMTLLELGEDCGLELPFDCRSGSCHTCETDLLEGQVDGVVSTDMHGVRRVLLCNSYPQSDTVRLGRPSGNRLPNSNSGLEAGDGPPCV